MAIDSIGQGGGSIASLRNLEPLDRPQTNPVPPPSNDDDRSSDATITDIRADDRQTLDTIRQGVDDASATGRVALAGAQSVSDTLDQIGQRLAELAGPAVSDDRRAALTTEIRDLVGQGLETVEQASFDGVNLLDGSRQEPLEVIAGRDGETTTLQPQDLRTGLEGLRDLDLSTPEAARTALDGGFAELRAATGTAVEQLATEVERLDERSVELRAQSAGLAGDDDVDTDLDADAALQAANTVQQGLNGQTLGIVNQRPETLIGLFR